MKEPYENNNSCVYCHTCKINGKKYVGQTKHGDDPNKRWRDGTHYESNQYFTNAINKYGWENFDHEILKEHLTIEEANYWEEYYTAQYKSNDPEFGYNLTSGGKKPLEISEETRQKCSIASKKREKRPRTDIEKQHISEGTSKAMMTGKTREHMLEVYASEEWRNQNAEFTRQQWKNTDLADRVAAANGKAVKCVETGKEYLSMSRASKDTGIPGCAIKRICTGNYKDTDKFHWEFI